MIKDLVKAKYFYLFSIGVIICLGILVYSNTFFCSFHFDDKSSIVDNFAIRNIYHLQDIWNFLPRRFILYLSIALNYHFNGIDVFGYHIFNLTVHLITAILVWRLMLLTFSTPVMKDEKIARHANLISLFVGLIFVAHPIQTEAVTYIVQRAASLVTLFYLASLCFYIKSRLLQGTTGRIYYFSALITTVLAMFTKETAITLPLMILLYEFSFFKNKKGFNRTYLAPFLLTIFIIPVTMFLTETGAERMQQLRSEPGISSMHYLLTQFRVIVTYIRLVFFPLNQNLDYDYPIFKNIFELPVITSLLFLTTILFFTKRLFLKYRLIAFSICWFFLTLLPESSLLPIKDVIFEHRLYLPMVGFSLFLVSGVYYLWGKSSLKGLVISLAVIITCYAFLTYQRNKIWIDNITLWNDVVSKSPHKARGYNNRGRAYNQQGNYSQAMSDFNKAIQLDPTFSTAYYNRGYSYSQRGQFFEAISDFDKALEIDPKMAAAYNDRGFSYDKQGHFSQAISDYNKAINIDPYLTDAYNNRGIFYVHHGDTAQAMSDFSQAIEIDPKYEKAYYNRGLIYAQEGYLTQAISDYTKAIKLNPKYLDAYYNRGLSFARQKDYIRAMADYDKEIELNPKDAQAYNNLAVINYQLGIYDKAWEDVHWAEGLGFQVNPKIISALSQSSGK